MKKLLSVILALVLLVSIMPTESFILKASAITSSEVKANIDNLKTTYGYIPGGKVGKDCYAFVTSLCNKFFGHGLPSQKTLYGGTMQLAASSNFSQIGSTLSNGAGNLSEANLKNLFLNSKCGDVVQMSYTRYANQSTNPNKTSKHTLMVYSVSSTGVVFYHSGSSNVFWGTTPGGSQPLWGTKGGEMSWAQLANIFRNSDNGISVYRSKNLNILDLTPTPSTPTSSTNPDSYPFPSKSVNNANYKAGVVTANEIKWVQAVLYQFGFLTSSGIDGKFGPNSVAATKKFQSAYGLTADGSAGPNTLNKMKNLWNAKKGTHTHTYNNACDATCNSCGGTRSVSHTYSNACDASCNSCGATRSVSNHKWSSNSCGSSYCASCDANRYVFHTYSNACDNTCNRCSATRNITHTYKTTTTKATTSKNGKIVKACTVCKKVASTTTIKYANTFKLSTTTYTYNGKVKTPSVTVKDSAGKTLKKNTDYTVTYAKGRKNVGTYKVTIKMKGKYSGTKTLTFKINPVKTKVSKLTAGKKSITVNISKKSTQVSGYQVQYSTSKKFTSAKTKTISSYKTTKYTLKSLKAKRTYYVRVRTYKTVSGKKYYSGWSTYKYVKTK